MSGSDYSVRSLPTPSVDSFPATKAPTIQSAEAPLLADVTIIISHPPMDSLLDRPNLQDIRDAVNSGAIVPNAGNRAAILNRRNDAGAGEALQIRAWWNTDAEDQTMSGFMNSDGVIQWHDKE